MRVKRDRIYTYSVYLLVQKHRETCKQRNLTGALPLQLLAWLEKSETGNIKR